MLLVRRMLERGSMTAYAAEGSNGLISDFVLSSSLTSLVLSRVAKT